MKAKVGDAMTRNVITVAPGATLREVAEVLSTNYISGAPVVTSTGDVVGVVSTTDLMDFAAETSGVPTLRSEQAEWGESLGGDVANDEEEDSSAWFSDLYSDAGADVLERFHATDGPEWNVLEEHTADEIMTRRLIEIEPDADVRDAARLMLERGVHRLLVVRDNQLEGVLTTKDLLRLLAEQ